MFKHLLVPLDGSMLAEQALPMAQSLALRFNSRITLLQAVSLPYAVGYGHELSGPYYHLNSLNQELKREAAIYMNTRRQALHNEGITVDVQLVTGKSPAEAILAAVDELGADAIVMSTHGRSGMMRWVFGSVADKVLREATVPILLVRVSEKETPQQEVLAREGAASDQVMLTK